MNNLGCSHGLCSVWPKQKRAGTGRGGREVERPTAMGDFSSFMNIRSYFHVWNHLHQFTPWGLYKVIQTFLWMALGHYQLVQMSPVGFGQVIQTDWTFTTSISLGWVTFLTCIAPTSHWKPQSETWQRNEWYFWETIMIWCRIKFFGAEKFQTDRPSYWYPPPGSRSIVTEVDHFRWLMIHSCFRLGFLLLYSFCPDGPRPVVKWPSGSFGWPHCQSLLYHWLFLQLFGLAQQYGIPTTLC